MARLSRPWALAALLSSTIAQKGALDPVFESCLDLSCSTTRLDVIVQMFGWNWESLAQECTQYLGPVGLLIPSNDVISY